MRTSRLLVGVIVVGLLGGIIMAAPPKAPATEPPTAAVQGTNQFAFNLFAQLKDQPGNLFFSPYSITTALGMTAQGARGPTADQMYQVLGGTTARGAALHESYGQLQKRLGGAAADRGYQLAVANALWGQSGYHYMPQFLADSQKTYNAGLTPVDFVGQTEDARLTINNWVAKQTQDKIKDLIPAGAIDANTRLVLTNAIYFKGNWETQFKKEATVTGPFAVTADKKVDVPLMSRKGMYRYGKTPQMQLLELPYVKDELAMVVLLPTKVDGLADLENTLTLEQFNGALAKMHRMEVKVTLPKFKLTSQFGLADQLKKLGMPLAFNPGAADFSGMTSQEKLFISAVIHKAFVDVNEEGTEAAAATGVMMNTMAMIQEPEFTADHPFLFLIRDVRSGALLFMGRLAEPPK